MKSGTTTLYRLLAQHPDIYLPRKEIRFFSSENWHKGFDWYKSLFDNYGGQKIVGEITPQYLYSDDAAGQIYRHLGPDVKFVCLLRNPVKRAFSDYRMHRRGGLDTKPFEAFIGEDFSPSHKDYDFVHKGLYAGQINRFLNVYPIENMKFIIFEEFINDQETHLKEVFDFLGIDRDVQIEYELHENPDFIYKHEKLRKAELRLANFIQKYIIRVLYKDKDKRKEKYSVLWHSLVVSNERSDKKVPKPSGETIRKLTEFYREDIAELENIIGRNLDIWKTNLEYGE